jgi:hypothetical protein
MALLTYGQPDDTIIQMAYVVADVHAAMRQWTDNLKAGPWFLLRDFSGVNPVYRGKPAAARYDIALGFAGRMQIELIGLRDDRPSVYRELVDSTGYGFQHFGVAARDFDGQVQRMRGKGYEIAFTAAVPSGGRVAYFDTAGAMPGMIELIEADAALDRTFTAIYEASVGWDGSDLVRDMIAP